MTGFDALFVVLAGSIVPPANTICPSATSVSAPLTCSVLPAPRMSVPAPLEPSIREPAIKKFGAGALQIDRAAAAVHAEPSGCPPTRCRHSAPTPSRCRRRRRSSTPSIVTAALVPVTVSVPCPPATWPTSSDPVDVRLPPFTRGDADPGLAHDQVRVAYRAAAGDHRLPVCPAVTPSTSVSDPLNSAP